MAVYTRVETADLEALLAEYAIGELENFWGIASGITNTNYCVDTTLGRWVLTLFEHMQADALPFFMTVMDHLAAHGVPGAHPVARDDGGFLSRVRGRPAALVYRLPGSSVTHPGEPHCRSLGDVVAAMHRAVNTLTARQTNMRDLAWIGNVAETLEPRLERAERTLLTAEIKDQGRYAASAEWRQLPQAVIHADIFRDNVLFDGHRVSGIIDFYYACHDYLLLDLAVICNDWCFDDDTRFLPQRWQAFIQAYGRRRALSDAEHRAWPGMLRAAALRFWVSRLYDYHFPMDGDVTHIHDPGPFERLLRYHRDNALTLTP